MKLNAAEIFARCKENYMKQLEQHLPEGEVRVMAKLMKERDYEREKEQNHGVEMTIHLCFQRLLGRKIGRKGATKFIKHLVWFYFRPRRTDMWLLNVRSQLRQLWNSERKRSTVAPYGQIIAWGVHDRAPPQFVNFGAKDEIGYPIFTNARYIRLTLAQIRATYPKTYDVLIKNKLI